MKIKFQILVFCNLYIELEKVICLKLPTKMIFAQCTKSEIYYDNIFDIEWKIQFKFIEDFTFFFLINYFRFGKYNLLEIALKNNFLHSPLRM